MNSDIVMVAHNPGTVLSEAAGSAVAQAGAKHVWVMDAESTDGSVKALRRAFPEALIVSMPNLGFAAACNHGIKLGSAPFVLLLNPDAVLLSDALAALTNAATDHPRAGIIGALVLNPDGSVQANSYGKFPSLTSALTLRLWRIFQRLRGNAHFSPIAPTSTESVDWVTGAAMLVRREAISDVGLLDEGFFLYYEDIDWCWRMRASGWEVLLEPRARVVHHLGSSKAVQGVASSAYRASFYRYCDLRGLRLLKAVSRIGLTLRRILGGVAS